MYFKTFIFEIQNSALHKILSYTVVITFVHYSVVSLTMKVDESQESQNKVGYIIKYSQSKIVSFTRKKVVRLFTRYAY